jgi:hypothetical protein
MVARAVDHALAAAREPYGTNHAVKTEASGLGYRQRKPLIVGNQNGSDTHMA